MGCGVSGRTDELEKEKRELESQVVEVRTTGGRHSLSYYHTVDQRA